MTTGPFQALFLDFIALKIKALPLSPTPTKFSKKKNEKIYRKII
jgi:hypothetical protein